MGKIHGVFNQTRPDDLLVHAIKGLLNTVPKLEKSAIEDVIIGCAMPEAEQGLNVGRIAALLAGLPESVPGMTVNRLCASGLQSIAIAADRIKTGAADVLIAGGVESMTMIPMTGNKPAMNPMIFADENKAIAYGMGMTAEKVAERCHIDRASQDEFALESHKRALAAIERGEFKDEIVPISKTDLTHQMIVDTDEGPRANTSLEALAKLRPAFAKEGTVTAGNSSQMSDGAAALLICSENALKKFHLTPMAKFLGFSVIGVDPAVMGIAPVKAIPMVLKQVGLKLEDLEWIELNEAFAAQSVAVIRELGLDQSRVNPLGGAISLGHPLGATGSIRATTLLHGMKRNNLKYGMVTMCIGTGMGAASIIERV
ncbi:acetyl-CoA acetyltransferase [Candidatus Thiomargarita nelsonii]|uniref:acetyl-CoA C-acyltransferase n=1 Tax=Candidatus Thiomargarita nelsonii TaxID=1003181 RepID=A0A176S1A9_9GAMM|nr:acetyl-CoA acetyltransferase [Candidatus Thiomargarita nelsonii]